MNYIKKGIKMTTIVLSHNPYLKQTNIKIDKYIVSSNSKLLSRIKDQPSGMWIESILGDMIEEYNLSSSSNQNELKICFCGTQQDFEDLANTVSDVEKRMRITISLTHQKLPEARELLKNMSSLFKEFETFGTHHQDFISDTFDNNKKNFKEAMLPNADVNVIATMSSGKSTLINSMIGDELLPAANEATTATITRILDNDQMKGVFNASRFGENNQKLDSAIITLENKDLLKEWNKNIETLEIHLEGDIVGVEQTEHSRLMLVDTPGPNNSQNEAHGLTTQRILNDEKMSIVLYVLNATQLGINDDICLLKQVKKAMENGGKQAHDRFMFVVNKIDAFDPEKGESVESALQKIREYLINAGIKNPNIYPISAVTTLLIRKKQLNIKLTRAEKADLDKMVGLFTEEPSMNMLQYMPISPNVKRIIESNLAQAQTPEEKALIYSGVPIIEAIINEYIEKYALPTKVNNCFTIFKEIISKLETKEKEYNKLLKQNEVDESKEVEIKNQLDELGEISDLVEKANRRNEWSAEFRDQLGTILAKRAKEVHEDLREFAGQVDPVLGKRKMQQMIEIIKYENNSFIVECEKLLQIENNNYINELKNSYMDKLARILDSKDSFSELVKMELNSIDFKKLLTPISDQPEILSEEVRKTGTRMVEKRKWYTLWLTKKWVEEEYTYSETVKFVDLDAEATKVVKHFETNLYKLKDEVEKSAKENRQEMIKNFASAVGKALESKKNEIIKMRRELLTNKSKRQQEIKNMEKVVNAVQSLNQKFVKVSTFE